MLISPHTGKVIHHNDCTYCEYRFQATFKKKGKKYEIERCRLHMQPVPESRCCSSYVQHGCACPECTTGTEMLQMLENIDNLEVSW